MFHGYYPVKLSKICSKNYNAYITYLHGVLTRLFSIVFISIYIIYLYIHISAFYANK